MQLLLIIIVLCVVVFSLLIHLLVYDDHEIYGLSSLCVLTFWNIECHRTSET